MGKSEASVTEWSKVLRSGRSVFARVGSSPTACIFTFLNYVIIINIFHVCNIVCGFTSVAL